MRNCKPQQAQVFGRSKNLFWFCRDAVEIWLLLLCKMCWIPR